MKLDPGFLNHWKTEILIEQLGSDGVVAILRLWGNAQIRREYCGLKLTPRRLALETKWKGDENHLFSVLTDPDAPWLDAEEGGTWAIHGFAEHQRQVVHLWEAGTKGGRPKKDSPRPPSKKDTSSCSSSYPICKANGNHMVSAREEREPAAAHEIAETGTTAAEMEKLQAKLQSVRDEWRLPLTYSEMQALRANARCLDGLTDEDWRCIRDYLHARIPEGMPAWQPRSRAKFLESVSDVYGYATEWRRKNASKAPAKPAGPPPKRVTVDKAILAEVFGSTKTTT
jgi:hypothetical protein